jgi:hypothetical protein
MNGQGHKPSKGKYAIAAIRVMESAIDAQRILSRSLEKRDVPVTWATVCRRSNQKVSQGLLSRLPRDERRSGTWLWTPRPL